MKNFLAVLLFLVLLGAGGLITFRLLNPERDAVQQSVNEFMNHIKNGNLYDAYRSTAAMVRSRSFEAFESGILRGGLVGWKSVKWNSVSLGSTESRFQGLVEPADGDPLPVTINLVREARGWKVFSLASERAGSLLLEEIPMRETEPDALPERNLPTEDEIKTLAHQTLLKFNEAVQIKYFGPFYQQISNAWQQQTTASELDEAFKVFMDSGVSFGNIRREDARFIVPPSLTPEGLLDVRGVFPSNDLEIAYELKYIRERSQWRLFSINVNLRRKE